MASATLSPTDVFINCPFDDDYAATFRAIVFTIFACSFRPRSARELDDGGQTRIDKLFNLIEECRYGIHDLSRTELDRDSHLPRFNMPLELGIFLGAKRYGPKPQKAKRLLILDIEQYRYQRFVSDLAGMDIHEHQGKPDHAIEQVRDWLANVSRRILPSSAKVARLYHSFLNDLPAIAAEAEFEEDRIPYVDLERIMASWVLEAPPANEE